MRWWHTIELPDGTVTPGRVDYRGAEGDRFLVPKDLKGKTVLDLGTFDGFWAIEAKKRGGEVIAADRWNPPLETAAAALGAFEVEYLWLGDLDFPLIWDEGKEYFDLVLFFGILYHLKNPYQGLFNAAQCCRPGGMVLVESAVNQGKLQDDPGLVPLLWVIDEVHHDDPTNYVMPNVPGLEQLCRLAGLNPLETVVSGTRATVKCRKEETNG